jgi:16S rRNA pseudouridine516 synthase
VPQRPQTLAQILFSQGFGTRRDCAGLVELGLVEIDGQRRNDPFEAVDPDGLVLRVEGRDWPVREHALIALHKPAHTECSKKAKHHPSVYALLPAPLLRRDVQAVGRLDEDTTGLLLFTDDGALIHKLTSPKRHVPKLYVVDCAEPVTPAQVAQLLGGVVLHDDPLPVRAASCEISGERELQLTLTEGKYHQVKRMVAATGNHVVSLRRVAFGALQLPADLAPGQWRWVEAEAIAPGL